MTLLSFVACLVSMDNDTEASRRRVEHTAVWPRGLCPLLNPRFSLRLPPPRSRVVMPFPRPCRTIC